MSWRAEVLGRFATGEISREIALAQLLLSGEVPDPDTLPPAMAELAHAHADKLQALSGLARDGFDAADTIGIAALFDHLAATAPEAGVAFYSLGDPALLTRATDELVGVIRAWAPVADARVLDFGCGIGRVAAALGEARQVLGVDVSAGMIAQARARASAANLRFEQVDGHGLPMLADAGIDLVISADCFPFLVRAGTLGAALAEFARVLRAGGDLLVFNWSYRGDDAADVAEARALAERHGFACLRAGERPFAIWDGRGFHLRRR